MVRLGTRKGLSSETFHGEVAATTTLDIERLLRIRTMCADAAAMEIPRGAASQYVDMANELTQQMISDVLKPDADLRNEFGSTFADTISGPRGVSDREVESALGGAKLRFRLVASWIDALLEGQQLISRIRDEAEAAALARLQQQ